MMSHFRLTELLFITAVLLVCFLCIRQARYRWLPLLAACLLLYWFVAGEKLLALLAYSLLFYGAGWLAGRRIHKIGCLLLLIGCLLPPAVMKIWPCVFAALAPALFSTPIEYLAGLPFPVEIAGLSYFAFNGLSYVVDVRRGYIPPSRNYGMLLLYLFFFPVLLAGPLHRAKNLMRQFRHIPPLSARNLSLGFRLVLWGLFKNQVLAGNFYAVLGTISGNETGGFFVLLRGLVFFMYLYCNFSAYVDIARGIAQCMGITVAKNFSSRVYAAPSRKKFWEGWHITLNHWFRDYFFFPLAKKLKSRMGLQAVTLLTFLFIGLWHGFSLQFAIWGLLNGAWIILEQRFMPKLQFLRPAYRMAAGRCYHLFTASFLALIFSSTNLMQTFSRLFSATAIAQQAVPQLARHGITALLFFGVMDAVYRRAGEERIDFFLERKTAITRWSFYLLLVMAILLFTPAVSSGYYYIQF